MQLLQSLFITKENHNYVTFRYDQWAKKLLGADVKIFQQPPQRQSTEF